MTHPGEPLRIFRSALDTEAHRELLCEQLDAFACDPATGGRPLPPDVHARLPEGLRERGAVVLFAMRGDAFAGLAIALPGYATFSAREILNLHDLFVAAPERGKGVGRALLSELQEIARQRGCAKLTLEVRADNTRAREVYEAFGFGDFAPGDEAVPTLFLEKRLDEPGSNRAER